MTIRRKILPLVFTFAFLPFAFRLLRNELRRVEVKYDIPYVSGAADPLQRLDLYLPRNVGFVTPVLVLVHGGAWTSGYRGQLGVEARNLALQGILVVVPDYRLSPAVRYPSHRDDLIEALKWTEAQAERLGFRKEHIKMLGLSAGAHLVASVAGSQELSSGIPSGFIGMAGTYDLMVVPAEREHFYTSAFGPRGPSWAGGSPVHNPVVNRAPWILIHAADDDQVDSKQSRLFADYLRGQGIGAALIVAQGFGHSGIFPGLGSPQNPFTDRILSFLRQ